MGELVQLSQDCDEYEEYRLLRNFEIEGSSIIRCLRRGHFVLDQSIEQHLADSMRKNGIEPPQLPFMTEHVFERVLKLRM